MKKILTVLFCCISTAVFCQTYHFDYLLKYNQSTSRVKNRVQHNLVNSTNRNIYMEIGNNMHKDTNYGLLVDNDNSLVHRFSIDDINAKDLVFRYEESWKIKDLNCYKYDHIKIERTADLTFKVKTVLKNNKKRNRNFEFVVSLVPHQKKLLFLDYEALTEDERSEIVTILENQFLIDNKNYIIKKFTANENSCGIAVKSDLLEAKFANINIVLDSKNLIMRDYR